MVLAVEVGTLPTVVEQLLPDVTVAAAVVLCRDTGWYTTTELEATSPAMSEPVASLTLPETSVGGVVATSVRSLVTITLFCAAMVTAPCSEPST